MFLTKIKIYKYRLFENLEINLEKNNSFPNVFSIASVNGGGKSTLLQFVFTMLHCFMDDDKKQYIRNLLENEELEEGNLARFELSIDGKDYFLEFLVRPIRFEGKKFDLFENMRWIKEFVGTVDQNKIIYLKKLIENNNKITSEIKREFSSLGKGYVIPQADGLYHKAKNSDNIDDYKNFINLYDKTKNDVDKLEEFLKKENLLYITNSKNNKKVIFLRSNVDNTFLNKLSKKVFLTAPSSQIFLFLSQNDKKKIFQYFNNDPYIINTRESPEYDYGYNRYESAISLTKREIKGFFNYDFVTTDVILSACKKIFEEDGKIKIKTGKYGNNYDKLEQELHSFLENKIISIDDNLTEIKFRDHNKELLPEDLSHGELKKLSIYIWLKYLVEEDSIVLMDELDIALHPSWQYEIVEELNKWSKNTQFFLATHSPQILSSTYYKNLIVLDKQDGISTAKQLNQAPLDRDINTILKTIMGADYIPKYLEQLHDKYLELVEDGKVDTKEAQELKAKLLEYESENSLFFQGVIFDLALTQ